MDDFVDISEHYEKPKCVVDEENIRFTPPVFLQRYYAVLSVLDDPRFSGKISKIVDFGCSTLNFLTWLRNLNGVIQILEVDCDEALLRRNSHRAEPPNACYFMQRTEPLTVSVLHGSICDPDLRLIGCDAVVCIEIIEHLNPGTLDRLPHNIFHFVEPLVAIFTTPNVEFNTLFPGTPLEHRHLDHRFEWTRQQFRDWALMQCTIYPNYHVEFKNIGPGPEGTEKLGGCSQMAIFVHQNYKKKTEIAATNSNALQSWKCITEELDLLNFKYVPMCENTYIIDANEKLRKLKDHTNMWDNINWEFECFNNYDLIEEYIYPFKIDSRTAIEKIMEEIPCRLQYLSGYDSPYFNEETYQCEIPVERLLPHDYNFEITIEEFRCALSQHGYTLNNGNLIHLYDEADKGSDCFEEETLQELQAEDISNEIDKSNWD